MTMADSFLQKALKIEKTEFGARPEPMAELLQTIALNKDEIQRMISFSDEMQIPKIIEIIAFFEEAIAIRKTLDGDKNKSELGTMLNRAAFYYAELKDLGGHGDITQEIGVQKARDNLNEAISLFKQLDDEAKVADCLITRGITYERGNEQQLQDYKEAETILLRTVGELHQTMTRVHINVGVYYEDTRNYNKALDAYLKYYQLVVQLYGENHSRVKRSIETLNEPFYVRLLRQRGIPQPTFPTEGGGTKA